MPEEFGSSTLDSYIYSICANYTAAVQEKPITLIGNPYMFTARRYDLETGLYYYRARYYNPYIGRFLQKDPANDVVNYYTYCINNPINLIDPYGWGRDPEPFLSDPQKYKYVSPDVPFMWKYFLIASNFLDMGKAPDYPVAEGRKWTINDFFNWYRYAPDDPDRDGWGSAVDIAEIGLLEDFQNHEAVKSHIAKIQNDAKWSAMLMAWYLELAWARYNALPIEKQLKVKEPDTLVKFEYDRVINYQFAPNVKWQTIKGDPLVVFGKGFLNAHVIVYATIDDHHDAAWYASVTWNIYDEFKDPEGTGKEWSLCRPYALTGTWYWAETSYNEFDDGGWTGLY